MDEDSLTNVFRKYNPFTSPREAVEAIRRIYASLARLEEDYPIHEIPGYAEILGDGCIDVGVEPQDMRALYQFVLSHVFADYDQRGNSEDAAARLSVAVARYLKKDKLTRSLFSAGMDMEPGEPEE